MLAQKLLQRLACGTRPRKPGIRSYDGLAACALASPPAPRALAGSPVVLASILS